MKQTSIPARADVQPSDCWDLSSLYAGDKEWEEDRKNFAGRKEYAAGLRKALEPEATAEGLQKCLSFYSEASRQLERLYVYAHLKHSADESDPENLDRFGRISMDYAAFSAEFSWFIPAVQRIPEDRLRALAGDSLR